MSSHCEEKIRLQPATSYICQPDEDGDIALHLAVIHGDVNLVTHLLTVMKEMNISIDFRNNLFQSPLHLSIMTNNIHVMELLLLGGASLSLTNSKGFNSFHLTTIYNAIDCLRAIVNMFCIERFTDAINEFDYDGFTPLHRAVMLGNAAAIRLLLSAGANVDSPDGKSGRTPLFHAAEENRLSLCDLLLNNGRADPNVPNYSGTTAVYAANGRRLTQVVALLVRHGADVCLPALSDEYRSR